VEVLGLIQTEQLPSASGFPDTAFGQQLAQITGILKGDMPFRILHATQTGYDTHLGQPGRLQKRYTGLNQGLSVLMHHLRTTRFIATTTVLVYSEFGRSIDENKNEGTDHGGAGLCLLMGNPTLIHDKAFNPNKKRPLDESLAAQQLQQAFDLRDVQKRILEWL